MNKLLPSEACALAADRDWYPVSNAWIKSDENLPDKWGCCAIGAVMMLQPTKHKPGSQHHRWDAERLGANAVLHRDTQMQTARCFDDFVDFWRHSQGEYVYPGGAVETFGPFNFIKEMGVDAGLHGPDASLNEMEDAFAALDAADVWRAAGRMLKARGC
ncbi:hypothetical protein [Herbaspirillum sp.]|uniref:hypothetical protein n=1 Tax=Herbaspirillum sp. TaxID=1890675 RepID=UPI000C120DCA|nr:hypothetical protein [Herbaspirillum sp.]MBO18868.1 hypothetical protein [Herbaspirillum sp.]